MELYYVASYPKSGATWFRTLMYGLFEGAPEFSREVQQFYPELPTEIDIVRKNIETKKPLSFIKSHYAYEKDMEFLDKCTGVIYITRNPLNVMLSKLDHYKYEGVKWVESDEGLLKFCEDFIQESNKSPGTKKDLSHGGWVYNVISWLKSDLNIPLIHITYEDLINDGLKVLTQLNETFKWGKNEKEITRALQIASFENVRKLEEKELKGDIKGMFYSPKRKASFMKDDNNRFVRVGGKRDAYLELPTEVILRAKIAMFRGMQAAGYK